MGIFLFLPDVRLKKLITPGKKNVGGVSIAWMRKTDYLFKVFIQRSRKSAVFITGKR